MEDIQVINHIKEMCKQRGWSYYELAKRSGIPYSSLNTMLSKQHVPTMNNLIKICHGFNIPLSQFFIEIEKDSYSSEQEALISIWNTLSDRCKELTMVYMYGLAHKEIPLTNNGDETT